MVIRLSSLCKMFREAVNADSGVSAYIQRYREVLPIIPHIYVANWSVMPST